MLSNFGSATAVKFCKHYCNPSVKTETNVRHYQKFCSFALTSVKNVFHNLIYISKMPLYFQNTDQTLEIWKSTFPKHSTNYDLWLQTQERTKTLLICFRKQCQDKNCVKIQTGLCTRGAWLKQIPVWFYSHFYFPIRLSKVQEVGFQVQFQVLVRWEEHIQLFHSGHPYWEAGISNATLPSWTTHLCKGVVAKEFSPKSTEGRMQNLNMQKGEMQLITCLLLLILEGYYKHSTANAALQTIKFVPCLKNFASVAQKHLEQIVCQKIAPPFS